MTRRTLPITALVLLAVAAVATVALAASGASGPATVKSRSTNLGTIVVDAKGRTLYLFQKDHGTKSACSGSCASNWPPLLTKGKPTAAGGARKAKLGTIRRSDGSTQVTYSGHPLYRFVGDNAPGSTMGEGVTAFGAKWYVVGTPGKRIAVGGSGGY